MEGRIQYFQCRSMPKVKTGMDAVYRKRAMNIIHWVVHMLDGMDLFENKLNDTPKFDLLPPPGFSPESDQAATPEVIDLTFEDMPTVTEAVLPREAVERAHLDVYDASGPDHQVIPYRLTSPAYALDSDAYHRQVEHAFPIFIKARMVWDSGIF